MPNIELESLLDEVTRTTIITEVVPSSNSIELVDAVSNLPVISTCEEITALCDNLAPVPIDVPIILADETIEFAAVLDTTDVDIETTNTVKRTKLDMPDINGLTTSGDGSKYLADSGLYTTIAGTGGDMAKTVYDQNDNGVVDDAEKVNGHTVETDVPAGAVFTDTVYDDTPVTQHIADTDNPHSTTYQNIGGTQPSPIAHDHVETDITDLDKYTQAEVDQKFLDNAFTPDTFTGAGTTGYVPDPLSELGYVLNDDGTWKAPPVSPVGGVELNMRWDSDTTATEPASGDIKVNNVDQLLATELYASETTRPGNDVEFIWDSVHAGDYIGIWEAGGEAIYYHVISEPIDNGTWVTVGVEYVAGDGGLDNNRAVSTFFILDPTNKLPRGGSTGQVLSKISANDYDTEWLDAASGGGETGPMHVARYRSIAGQSAGSATPIVIAWDTAEVTDSVFSVSGSQITVSNDGKYLFSGGVGYYDNATSRVSNKVKAVVNGTPMDASFEGSYIRSTDGLSYAGITYAVVLDLTAGDIVEISSEATAGTNAVTVTTAGTSVSMVLLDGVIGPQGADGPAGSGAGIPIGGIIMYNGAFSAIPTNYQLCDGTNGTPDMTDRFAFGTSTEGDIGNAAGSSAANTSRHFHTTSGTTGSDSHDHTTQNVGNSTQYLATTNFWASTSETVQCNTSFAIKALSSTNNGSPLETDSDSHNHTISVDTGYSGTDNAVGNIPPYIKLAYIRRMS